MSMQREPLDPEVERYLTTLRRIPVEVRQSMATREFDMGDPTTCVCGWAIQDSLTHAVGRAVIYRDVKQMCVEQFGGSYDEWDAIFGGVCYTHVHLPNIETAFTIAVSETVPAPRKRKRGA